MSASTSPTLCLCLGVPAESLLCIAHGQSLQPCTSFLIKGKTDFLFYNTVHSLMKQNKTRAYKVEHTNVENSMKAKYSMFQEAEAISCVQWHLFSGVHSRLNICYLNAVWIVYAICLSIYLYNCRNSANVLCGPSCVLTEQKELYRTIYPVFLALTCEILSSQWAFLSWNKQKHLISCIILLNSPWFLMLLWLISQVSSQALNLHSTTDSKPPNQAESTWTSANIVCKTHITTGVVVRDGSSEYFHPKIYCLWGIVLFEGRKPL